MQINNCQINLLFLSGFKVAPVLIILPAPDLVMQDILMKLKEYKMDLPNRTIRAYILLHFETCCTIPTKYIGI